MVGIKILDEIWVWVLIKTRVSSKVSGEIKIWVEVCNGVKMNVLVDTTFAIPN